MSRVAVALDNARLYDISQTHLGEVKALYHQVSELEQLKTHMIRVAAHDLRSPLGVVSGYIAILQEELGDQSEQYQMYLKPIDRAIQRMQQMSTDILSLERVHSAQHKEWEPMTLRELVERALLDSRDQATLKQQAFAASIVDSEISMRGDPVQLYEAVTNLIGNAIKYTLVGGSVSVRLDTEDGQAVFEVKDTGIGVPADYQAKLFQPFFRVKTEETRQIDGTGLGLYLVKSIVERHGGTMIFSSVHGQGSTFGFKLPLAKPE
jgi:signal transduction histidine kinase